MCVICNRNLTRAIENSQAVTVDAGVESVAIWRGVEVQKKRDEIMHKNTGKPYRKQETWSQVDSRQRWLNDS